MTRAVYSMTEWDALEIGRGGVPVAVADALAATARRQARHLRLGPDDVLVRGHGALKSGQVCGIVSVPGTTVEILPKIALDATDGRSTLIRMLAVAEDVRLSGAELAETSNEQHDLLEVVLRLFARRVLAALKGGVPRAYVAHREDLALLRGALDVTRQLTRHAARPDRVACRFDELSPDIPLNMIIAAAIRTGCKNARTNVTQRLFDEALVHYEEVTVSRQPLALRAHLDRSTAHWREVLALARLLLRSSHQGTHAGAGRGFALLFPMHELFESFVARLARSVFGMQARVQDSRHWVTSCNRFRLIPDLVIELPEQTVILDTKWKTLDPAHHRLNIAPADAYQMLAYGHAYRRQGRDLRLVLAYPARPGEGGAKASWNVQGSEMPLDIVALEVADRASVISGLRNLHAIRESICSA
ncbi:5-methylcytosine-specific restriction enzyme subunit McrC [Tranquillimonas rosea]|uniref:5-methylcytosine-specific restriction enzyme subunit McrC n=1 Tax=Tranquillimonas rosea TaxID=641238 RepID=A0A1H9PIM7_9RHOB|nr:hypothetical protein [Tranquillimonas rosea]SER47699.1 5-methylcytosine-specific restriction enzyme subunit McrC [Tranquillimonas rosea]